MPDESIIQPKDSVDRLLSDENLKNVFQYLFNNTVILTTEVKKGAKSSANVYVNKKYEGKKAMVIIWE